jgi:SAM-dependent methyltransferase
MSEAGDRDEAEAVRGRYARRVVGDARYSLQTRAALLAFQERQRALLALFARLGWADLSTRRLVEIGSGTGSNLLECLLLGFAPENLVGIELLQERHAAARRRLPAAVSLIEGDAISALPGIGNADIVMQYTVFSSLLDDAFQQRLADAMWRAVRPGGGVLWYDFTYDNPGNADVRGVPLKRIRALFPEAHVDARRVTLAPPIARAVAPVHPALYTLFNALSPLRTHLLAWIAKP